MEEYILKSPARDRACTQAIKWRMTAKKGWNVVVSQIFVSLGKENKPTRHWRSSDSSWESQDKRDFYHESQEKNKFQGNRTINSEGTRLKKKKPTPWRRLLLKKQQCQKTN